MSASFDGGGSGMARDAAVTEWDHNRLRRDFAEGTEDALKARQGGEGVAMAKSQDEPKGEVRRIYAEANAFAHKAGGVDHGMNILYTPPRLRPKVMIVTMQGAGDDQERQYTWPDRNQYAFSRFPLGREMTADFDRAGMSELFRADTVASNLAFPQAKDFGNWRRTGLGKTWLTKSRRWLDELIALMAPRSLLTYGSPPFKELTGQYKVGGQMCEATYGGIPVVGVATMRATRQRTRSGAPRCGEYSS